MKIVIEYDESDPDSVEAAVFKLRRQSEMLDRHLREELRPYVQLREQALNALTRADTLPKGSGYDATDNALINLGYDLPPNMVVDIVEMRKVL